MDDPLGYERDPKAPRDGPTGELCVLPDDQLRPGVASQVQQIIDGRLIGHLGKAEERLLPHGSLVHLIAGTNHPIKTEWPGVETVPDERRDEGGRGRDRHHMPAALELPCQRNHLGGVTKRRLGADQNSQVAPSLVSYIATLLSRVALYSNRCQGHSPTTGSDKRQRPALA